MDLDASWTQRKQTLGVFAEVEDDFLGVKCTVLWLVDLFRHLK